MATVEEKGRPNYNKFDSLDTAVLEAILQADFDAPEAEQIEAEDALYIASLLAKRQNKKHKDAETLMGEFFEYYYPCEELYAFDYSDLDTKVQNDNIQNESSEKNIISFVQKGWRRFASAVAVFVLFMFVGTVTAYALGYNPIGVIGRWNDEDFWFERDVPTQELIEALAAYSDEEFLVPKWLPAGYVAIETEVAELNSYIGIKSVFYRENTDKIDKLCIDFRFLSDNGQKSLYEKDTNEVEEYSVHNISHYIMTNLDKRVIAWRNGKIEGSIKGDFSLAEAKQIINSIYEE